MQALRRGEQIGPDLIGGGIGKGCHSDRVGDVRRSPQGRFIFEQIGERRGRAFGAGRTDGVKPCEETADDGRVWPLVQSAIEQADGIRRLIENVCDLLQRWRRRDEGPEARIAPFIQFEGTGGFNGRLRY